MLGFSSQLCFISFQLFDKAFSTFLLHVMFIKIINIDKIINALTKNFSVNVVNVYYIYAKNRNITRSKRGSDDITKVIIDSIRLRKQKRQTRTVEL